MDFRSVLAVPFFQVQALPAGRIAEAVITVSVFQYFEQLAGIAGTVLQNRQRAVPGSVDAYHVIGIGSQCDIVLIFPGRFSRFVIRCVASLLVIDKGNILSRFVLNRKYGSCQRFSVLAYLPKRHLRIGVETAVMELGFIQRNVHILCPGHLHIQNCCLYQLSRLIAGCHRVRIPPVIVPAVHTGCIEYCNLRIAAVRKPHGISACSQVRELIAAQFIIAGFASILRAHADLFSGFDCHGNLRIRIINLLIRVLFLRISPFPELQQFYFDARNPNLRPGIILQAVPVVIHPGQALQRTSHRRRLRGGRGIAAGKKIDKIVILFFVRI